MPVDSVLDLLRQGIVSFEGHLILTLGASVGTAAPLLGLDPEKPQNQWYETDGTLGQWWHVKRGFLWWGLGPFPLELKFLNDRLVRISGPEDGWTSAGSSWETFDQSIQIQNFRKTRAFFDERLGKPTETREIGDTLLVAKWKLGASLLTLYWETRTPSLTIAVTRAATPG